MREEVKSRPVTNLEVFGGGCLIVIIVMFFLGILTTVVQVWSETPRRVIDTNQRVNELEDRMTKFEHELFDDRMARIQLEGRIH